MTDHALLKLEKHYTWWIERRWHIPNKPPFTRLAIGLLVSIALIQHNSSEIGSFGFSFFVWTKMRPCWLINWWSASWRHFKFYSAQQLKEGKGSAKKVPKQVTEKPFTSMKKGDIGMAKHFSKQYGNKGWPFNYLQSEYKLCQHACLCLMLHPHITAFRRSS